MATAAANPSVLFQYYLDNHFQIPNVIRDDIVYCQRAMRSHIKVYQMVTKVFREQKDLDPRQKTRVLAELESEIYEINAELNFLFLRLRRIIDEFDKTVHAKGVPCDTNAINMVISQEIVPLIGNERFVVQPLSVVARLSEKGLMHKYFEMESDNGVVYEISDSEDDDVAISDIKPQKPQLKMPQGKPQKPRTAAASASQNGAKSTSPNQVSLLKPMAQRLAHCAEEAPPSKAKPSKPGEQAAAKPAAEISIVKQSRMNLRQALKKAVKEASGPAKDSKEAKDSKPNGPQPSSSTSPVNAEEPRSKKGDAPNTRATRSTTAAAATSSTSSSSSRAATPTTQAGHSKSPVMNTSSDDSNPERDMPAAAARPRSEEPVETVTLPEHCGAEGFLSIFGLYTPAKVLQMQQRRSKRKRRSVHNNEKADFHYGRIEYGSYPPPEKKRKEFLLSPQVKRGLQSKRGAPAKRPGSSSPDEKRCCKECLKSGDHMDQCDDCKGFFHPSCKREEDDAASYAANAKKVPPPSGKEKKSCATCKRAQQKLLLRAEAERNKALHSSAKQLEVQMAEESCRSSALLKEGQKYKVQMRKLLTIVKTIRENAASDGEERESE